MRKVSFAIHFESRDIIATMSGPTATPSWRAPAIHTSGYGQITLALHPITAADYINHKRRAPLGQFFGLIQKDEVLLRPTALFRGLLRPLSYPSQDDDVFVYVTRPVVTYTFSSTGSLAPYGPLPDCVFVAFVSFTHDVLNILGGNPACSGAEGGVVDWEWTQADATMPYLPADYQTRYRRTLWVKR